MNLVSELEERVQVIDNEIFFTQIGLCSRTMVLL